MQANVDSKHEQLKENRSFPPRGEMFTPVSDRKKQLETVEELSLARMHGHTALADFLAFECGGRHALGMSPSPELPKDLAAAIHDLESCFKAKVVMYESDGALEPGGMCNCCGCGPNVEPEWRGDPWLVYRAGVCDSDGVHYGMLCEGCLEEIREENANRPQTERDENAKLITELLGDDIDGAQSMMDDRW